MLPLWSLLLAIGVEDVPNPRLKNRWVSDTARVIPADSEARLESLLEQIHRATQAEIAVVTVDDVSGTPKQFATALFNHWGVGSAERNDGVLFLMVMDERRLEVEVGYGLEDTLPDGWLGSMQTRSMVPRFKQRDFAGGLEVGVLEVGRRLGASELPDPSTVPVSSVPEANAPLTNTAGTIRYVPGDPAKPGSPWPIYVFYGLLGVGGLGLFGAGIRGARVIHNKRCQPCKTWRTVLPEDEDDAHLSAGQQREEELCSVDYDVFVCSSCSSVSVMAKRRWFSGHSRCRSCGFRTATTSSRTIHAATTHSSGMAEVTESCHHCNHEHTSLRTIPAKGSSSSGGSSFGGGGGSSFGGGGSSFGGGRSGGGGAGSSW
jgi:uncharacterized protein